MAIIDSIIYEQDEESNQGAITSQTTITQQDQMTPVQQMFNGRSVFITGASGFIGRVLLFKLLSSFPGIKNIYILMRSKKNMSPDERLAKQILQLPIFDQIRDQKCPSNGKLLIDKIRIIPGDIGEPWFGMNNGDLHSLISDPTLAIVFHSAATIKFDEPLRISVKLNLIATKTIIDLCKRLPNLVSLCHVSTAYVNSDILDNSRIEERIYPMREQPESLIRMAELMDEPMMQQLKLHLVDKRPNTYTYTKALAEHLIAQEGSDLPIAVVRPSIVVASWREPIPGWIDNFNGPSGLLLAINKGLLRTMYVKNSGISDLIPVDITVNTMIASAYYIAKKYNKLAARIENPIFDTSMCGTDRPFIVHCNSGQLNPITWGTIEKQVFPIIRDHPSNQIMRYPFGTFKKNYYHDLLTRVFVHLLPAIILDLCIFIKTGNSKGFFVPIYKKVHAAVGCLTHFCINNYNFETKNLASIRRELSVEDNKILQMNIEDMNWLDFWKDYIIGIR